MKNTYLLNFGFKECGYKCWYCERTDHFIVKSDDGYHLSYVFGANLGIYTSLSAVERFLSGAK